VPCLPLQIGEVWISGSTKAAGYWRQEQLTLEAFRATTADGGLGYSGDGYLRTGDYGFFHEGELYANPPIPISTQRKTTTA
jgi:acyl-CoA synthetase (AMP-forming)/AMP-acid ligase II